MRGANIFHRDSPINEWSWAILRHGLPNLKNSSFWVQPTKESGMVARVKNNRPEFWFLFLGYVWPRLWQLCSGDRKGSLIDSQLALSLSYKCLELSVNTWHKARPSIALPISTALCSRNKSSPLLQSGAPMWWLSTLFQGKEDGCECFLSAPWAKPCTVVFCFYILLFIGHFDHLLPKQIM